MPDMFVVIVIMKQKHLIVLPRTVNLFIVMIKYLRNVCGDCDFKATTLDGINKHEESIPCDDKVSPKCLW